MNSFKQALRQFAAHPGYGLVTVLTLGLGIGVNTAIFSMARGVLLRRLPYSESGALVHIVPRIAGTVGGELYFSVPEVLDYARQTRTLAAVAEYHSMAFNLLGHGEPDRVETGVVSANFFRTFGVAPLLGRDFRAEDEQSGAEPTLLLTYGYWRDRFGEDPGVVGQRLRMNGRSILVIGVLPPLPEYPGKEKVFMPTSGCPFRSSEEMKRGRNLRMVSLWGRLRPGLTLSLARADLATVNARLQREYPAAAVAGMTVSVVPVAADLLGSFRQTLIVLLATACLVLLIACANAANLTYTRLLSRDKELLLRGALGASRSRLVRQMVTESMLTSLLGGILGCALAFAALRLLVAFAYRFTARAGDIRIDAPVLLFSLLLALAAGLASGWVPAAQALRRRDLGGALREESGRATASAGRRRFQSSMVAAQVGVSFVLLIGAGLMIRSLLELLRVDPGFRTARVLTATVELPFSKYGSDPQMVGFFQQLIEKLADHPRVVSAAVSSDVPMTGSEHVSLRIQGLPVAAGRAAPRADLHVASDEYFRTLDIPLLAGREFGRQDGRASPRVAIVNRELARRCWPERSPVGQHVALEVPGESGWRLVVGVVGDVRQQGLAAPAGSAIYLPFVQFPSPGTQVFVRTRGDPSAFVPELRAVVHAVDSEQPVADPRTLDEVYSASLAPARLTTSLVGLFAALALAITGIGIGAAVSFAVAERFREMAIRMALGASGHEVLYLLFRQAMGPVLSGLALGIAGAVFLTRLLGSLLYGVKPTDPVALAAALLVLLATGVVTCLIPARRGAKADPMAILRA
jgi:putative ABC transport system permease protein